MAVATSARNAARATRSSGQRTRSALLDAAARLFGERGLADVSLTEIAAIADAFPSQVTYYFGSKEALFVEAACREVLHAASAVEAAGRRTRSKDAYAARLSAVALDSPALPVFAEALLLARHRRDLRPLIARTLDRLHHEGARAVAERCAAQGWSLAAPPVAVARAFWATVLGIALESAGAGDAFDRPAAEAAVLATLSSEYPSRLAATRARRADTP
ncbi:MAG TPA: TetR/AcrR family transcriptional regulator C-terminal domain-containing protein [Candidatus Dormibacteraeota bacterium]|jgi:AcrR family transcriptional regulator|nr:TetR/AcrR family transcriptional regulator C-terminal domain-containing protein [Candidatus Dormibacteraeota bacterium]